MNSETRQCQGCQRDFTIQAEDFDFYKKVQVPAPKLCPDCRFKRRSIFRNERTLYKRQCDLCKKSIVSMYHPQAPYTVFCVQCYESDAWDPYSYQMAYDQKRPFFDQLKELFEKVPKQAMYLTGHQTNSDYTNYAGPDDKDCYLIFNSGKCDTVMYSRGLKDCRFSLDSYFGTFLEDCYEVVNGQKSSGVIFGQNVVGCVSSMFLLNCNGCTNCFGCVNLRHKSYCWFNEQLTKEEYERRLAEVKGSYEKFQQARKDFEKFSLQFPRRSNANLKSVGVVGDYIFESKNVFHGFEVANCEDCKYVFFSKGAKDSYDTLGYGFNSELLYNVASVGYSSRIIASALLENCQDVSYSLSLNNSRDCFGSDSIRNGQYCILNKQYTKEEYALVRQGIIEELKTLDIYGDYFPQNLGLFGYNESINRDNLVLTKEEAERQGFRWVEDVESTRGQQTVEEKDLIDNIADVNETITKEILECRACQKNYRIIPNEFAFYKRIGIPLPHRCFSCRHEDRLRRRGPLKMFDRNCARCEAPIQTNFSPDRPEIVYCEACYNSEVV